MPMLDTADLRQKDDWSCGAVALDVLFRYHGLRLPAPMRSLADPAKGMDPATLELIVRRHLVYVAAGRWDLRTLRAFAARTPVVCHVVVRGDGGVPVDHYVVARGVTRTRVHAHCPSRGRYDVPHAEWLAGWTDTTGSWPRFALTGWPEDPD